MLQAPTHSHRSSGSWMSPSVLMADSLRTLPAAISSSGFGTLTPAARHVNLDTTLLLQLSPSTRTEPGLVRVLTTALREFGNFLLETNCSARHMRVAPKW